jgi:hypothetical protein
MPLGSVALIVAAAFVLGYVTGKWTGIECARRSVNERLRRRYHHGENQ